MSEFQLEKMEKEEDNLNVVHFSYATADCDCRSLFKVDLYPTENQGLLMLANN